MVSGYLMGMLASPFSYAAGNGFFDAPAIE
jgi:hypothetical protein